MTIGKSIKQLLEERKRVILPGFGNLDIKESGDRFPASGKKIDPPGLTVKFDGSYSKDDGLLTSTLAREEQIDPEEANQQVLELVDAIKFALDKGEPYSIDGAGIFSRDDGGKVYFQTESGWVLEPDQYGLESMDLLELEEVPEEEAAPVEPQAETGEKETDSKETDKKAPAAKEPDRPKEPAKTKETARPEEPAKPKEPVRPKATVVTRPKPTSKVKPPPTVYEPWKSEKPKRRPAWWRVLWIVAGALIVVLVALILIPADRLDLFGGRDGTEQQTPVETPVSGSETTDPAGEDTPQAAGSEEAVTEEAEQVPEPAEATPAEETVEAHHYFIIAGSFKHLGNASELQDQMKARGYEAEVMVTENRMYRVSVASYATKVEAERAITGVKSEPGLESCWLLSNE